MSVSCVCCVLCRYRPLRRADHSLRGVLSGVRVLTVRDLRDGLGPILAVSPKQQKIISYNL
jgi:hypothetical protein